MNTGGIDRAAIAALTWIAALCCASAVQAQPSPTTATPLTQQAPATRSVHSQSTTALIYYVGSGRTDVVPVPGDDVNLPDVGELPMSDVGIHRPIRPARRSFPKIVFGDGNFCSGTAVGRRLILTAGHCVFDKDGTNAFRKSALIYSGYPPEVADHTSKARRFIAFNGWTSSRDTAHDIALIETETDLAPDIELFELSSDAYACTPNGAFRRHFYDETSQDQQLVDAVHLGCRNNMYFWALGTAHGSSGSAAVKFGTNQVYGVYSFSTEGVNHLPTGNAAPLTAGKICFIRNMFFGDNCQPPENVGEPKVALESTRIEVIQGAGFVDVVVNRIGSLGGTARIHYDTRSITAMEGRDFRRTQGLLTWADGDGNRKIVRIPLIPASDPGCEREFALDLKFVPAILEPPGDTPIVRQTATTIGIISSSRPSEDKQLVLKQFLIGMDALNDALPAQSLLQSNDGRSLFAYGGFEIASFWRDSQRGTLRFQRLLRDAAAGVGLSINADGRHLVRLANPEVQVLGRQPPSTALSKISGLGFDYDRYTQYAVTQSQDGRADVYITAHNANVRRPGLLRYRHDAVSGALTDKWQIRAGEGGVPNVQGIYSIKVTKNGRFVLALGSQPNSLLSFRRNTADGTLTFVEAQIQPFSGYEPTSFIFDPYDNFVFVVAAAPGNRGRIFPFLIGISGDLSRIVPMDVPSAGRIAMSADSKQLYLIGGGKPWLYKYDVDGTVLRLAGTYDPQRCFAKSDLNTFVADPIVSPDGRFVTLVAPAAPERAIVVLERAD